MDRAAALPPDIWDHTPPEAQAYIRALEARVTALEGMRQALHAPLKQTSRNASRPPLSDPPAHPRPRRPRSKRRRGGQPGHPGSTRTLLPVEAVDEVVSIKPEACTYCQARLSGDAPTPWRPQVMELPPIKPIVTEYQWHPLFCSAGGEVTRAPWPAGVPSGTYGPRVQATVALCTGAYRLSKRATQQMMHDVFALPLRGGTSSQLEHATTAALAAPVKEARAYVQTQEVAHLDETRGRQGDQPTWLWVAVTTWVTVCVVRLSRSGHVARELLGETFAGILVTERSSADNWYPVRWRQLCWAHLLRDFEAMRGRGGSSEALGDALLGQAYQMCMWWHRVREGPLQRSPLRSYMTPLRREGERLLAVGSSCEVPQTAGTCRDILKRRQALWTFVQVDGVEPTNNTAERAIRPGVLWRKGSGGTQSAKGSRFAESMLSVVSTLQQQQRHVLAYLAEACDAALRGEAAPSLLPTHTQQSHAAA